MSRVSDRGPKRDCGVCYACFCSSALQNLRQGDHDEFKANTWAFQDITFKAKKKIPCFLLDSIMLRSFLIYVGGDCPKAQMPRSKGHSLLLWTLATTPILNVKD